MISVSLSPEDNGQLNATYVYTYDNAGNRTSKKTYALTAAGVTPYFKDPENNRRLLNSATDRYNESYPFTYRGYYYDADLGMYYLGSRYYDSTTGRFVNVDAALYHNMLGYNMFAYCYNNPITYVDYTGESAEAILTFLTGIAISEPTPIGEIVVAFAYATVIVVGTIAVVEEAKSYIENSDVPDLSNENVLPPKNITRNDNNDSKPYIVREVKSKDEVDPYRRPNQKKQRSELKNKSRRNDNFHDRSNKRNGRGPNKKHTPAKDHQKKSKNKKSNVF